MLCDTSTNSVAPQVGVFLVLLDVIAVLFGPHFPIDVPQVVAVAVLAVLQKLDRLPEVRTAMHAGEKCFFVWHCGCLES